MATHEKSLTQASRSLDMEYGVKIADSCSDASTEDSDNIESAPPTSVGHLLDMVRNRVAIDLSKVTFRSPAMLTCNLQSKQILVRELGKFQSREARIRRAKLKLIAVSAFNALLVKMRAKFNVENFATDGIVSQLRRRGSSLVKTAVTRASRQSPVGLRGASSPASVRCADSEDNDDDYGVGGAGGDGGDDEHNDEKRTKTRIKTVSKRNGTWLSLGSGIRRSFSRIKNKKDQKYNPRATRVAATDRHKKSCVPRTTRYWKSSKPLKFVGEAPYAGISLMLILASILLTIFELGRGFAADRRDPGAKTALSASNNQSYDSNVSWAMTPSSSKLSVNDSLSEVLESINKNI